MWALVPAPCWWSFRNSWGLHLDLGQGLLVRAVFRNHSVSNAGVLCICSWAWKLETEPSPVGSGMKGSSPLFFSQDQQGSHGAKHHGFPSWPFVLIQYCDFLPSPVKSIFTAFFLRLLISSLPSHGFYSFLRGGC